MGYKHDIRGSEYHFCLSDFAALQYDLLAYYQQNMNFNVAGSSAPEEVGESGLSPQVRRVLPNFKCSLSIFKLYERQSNNEMKILESLPSI